MIVEQTENTQTEETESSETELNEDALNEADIMDDKSNEEPLDETMAEVAARSIKDIGQRSKAVDFSQIDGYDINRQQAYENLLLMMPFYDPEQIVKDGNLLKVEHRLNTEKIDAVYPLDSEGIRVIGLSVEDAEKLQNCTLGLRVIILQRWFIICDI